MLNSAEHPLISVIVPVYNVEPFLKRCLNSLAHQTYGNLEILLIDDGSSDMSPRICDEYAERYSNVKVIHQQNKGLCGARNTGLDNASGEYIGFVDSDDWCALDMYQYLYDGLCKYNVDVSACGYYRVRSKGRAVGRCDGLDYVMDRDLLIRDIVMNFDFRTVFWNKLFKRSVFETIRFPEGYTFEGTRFMHRVLKNVKKAVLLGEPKYFYVDTVDSIVNTTKLVSPVNQALSCIARYNDLEADYPDLREEMMFDIGKSFLFIKKTHGTVARAETDALASEYAEIRAFYKKYKKPLLKKFGFLERRQISLLAKGTVSGIKRAHYVSGFTKLCAMLKLYRLRELEKRKPIRLKAETGEETDGMLKRLQGVLVEILKEIDRICRANHIQYYLYGGTLLGAVRDGKIIPWDDDMDIVMYRKDYDRFLEVCKTQLNELYSVQTCFNDPGYPMLFAKIRKNGTFIREEKWDRVPMHNGIFVDILPLDNYFPKGIRAEIGLKIMGFIHRVCTRNILPTNNPVKKIVHHIALNKPVMYWYKKRESILKWCNRHIHGDWVCSFGSHYQPMNRRILKKEWFGENEDIEFEGMICMSPKNPEGYLTHLFGEDYLKLPPKRFRVNHADLENIIL